MLLTAMLAMSTSFAAPAEGSDMGIGVSLGGTTSLTLKKWDTLDILPGFIEDGAGGVAAYVGVRGLGYRAVHARVNLEKDFWTPPWEFGFADQHVYWGVGVNADFYLTTYGGLAIGVGGLIGYQLVLNSFPLEIGLQYEPGINIWLIDSYYYGRVNYRGYYGLQARYYF